MGNDNTNRSQPEVGHPLPMDKKVDPNTQHSGSEEQPVKPVQSPSTEQVKDAGRRDR